MKRIDLIELCKEYAMSEKFLIHDTTRGGVGNSMVWWAVNHRGYTCDITRAHRFTEAEAIATVDRADDLIAYPEDDVIAIKECHVTAKSLLKNCREPKEPEHPVVQAIMDLKVGERVYFSMDALRGISDE